MTSADQQPTDQQTTNPEADRLSYRAAVPEDWRTEYDKLARRMQPRAAAAILRDRARRRKAAAAIPVADAVLATLGRPF